MRKIQAGSTSQILDDFIVLDSSSTTGAGLAGLAFGTAGLICHYHRNTASATVAVTLATMTLGTWATGGFKEVDATHAPGAYSFCPPDAALASGAQSVTFYFQGATNMAQTRVTVYLTATNEQDGVHGGMSALPNTAVTTNASLLTSGTGTDQLSVTSGKVLLQATQTGVTIPTVTTLTNVPANFTSLSINADGGVKSKQYYDAGQGAYENFPSNLYQGSISASGFFGANVQQWSSGAVPAVNQTGVPIVDMKYTLGTLSPATAGYVAPDWGHVNAPSTTVALSGTTVGTVTTVTGGATSSAVASVQSTVNTINVNTNTSGNTPGAAGGLALVGSNVGSATSVSGAVGSVTGNVGGTVAGIAGTTQTLDALQTALSSAHGAGSWATATGFATPTNITAGTITTVTNLTNAPTVGDFTSTMKTSLNAATPASVTGAVGSVTGAVGSVTGNVGGNVTGSVGSVTGNVGGTVASVVGNLGGNVSGSVASVVGNVGGNVVGSVGSVVAGVAISSLGAGVITTASIAAGAFTDAAFTVPAETAGPATGVLSRMMQAWGRFFRHVKQDKNAQTITVYMANGTTPWTTQVYTTNSSYDDVGAAT